MDRILRFFPHLLIFSYLIRLLIVGAVLGDALVMLVFGAIYCAHLYLDKIKEPVVNQDIREELKELKESYDLVKGKVSSLTAATAFRK